jgi:hypothetical protein
MRQPGQAEARMERANRPQQRNDNWACSRQFIAREQAQFLASFLSHRQPATRSRLAHAYQLRDKGCNSREVTEAHPPFRCCSHLFSSVASLAVDQVGRQARAQPVSQPQSLQRASKGFEEATLFLGQVSWQNHIHLSVEVATLIRLSQNRHALATQAERLAIGGLRRDLQ